MIATRSTARPADHLLVLDIGNSRTAIAAWSSEAVRTHQRIDHADDVEPLVQAITEQWNALPHPKQCIACSVVPHRTQLLRAVVRRACGSELQVVGHELPIPIPVDIAEPSTVGTDRLCCAAAAFAQESRSCAIADAGTALTIDCVNDHGRFIGGTILAGLSLQARALAEHTAQLPLVSMAPPTATLGQDTIGAVRSGIFLGAIGAVRFIVEAFAEQLGHWPVLVLTGGDAELLAGALEIADRVDPHLCLRGVVQAYRRAFTTSP